MVARNCSRLLFRPYFSKLACDANVVCRPVLLIHLQLYSRWMWISALCRGSLTVIDPLLAVGLKDGDAFQFGIRYGRHVEFEYEITTASATTTRAISNSLTHALAGPEEGSAFLPSAEGSGNNNMVRGVIKVSIARYNAWLERISAQSRRVNAASPQ